MANEYQIKATSNTPALIIYLIDTSGSMSEPFGERTKIECVQNALDRTLKRMVMRSGKGEMISPRYQLAMAAYNDSVFDMLQGIEPIGEVAARGAPTFAPMKGTNTYAAFEWARDLLEQKMPGLKRHPAPMVCHLTDGHYTTEDPAPLAREILQMANDDGHVLVENIYLGPELTIEPIEDIKQWPGIRDVSQLQDQYAKELFEISSPLPAAFATWINEAGYSLKPGCRMLIPGSSPELIELAITLSDTTVYRNN